MRLLSPDVLADPRVRALAAFVAANTLIYIGLCALKLFRWTRQRLPERPAMQAHEPEVVIDLRTLPAPEPELVIDLRSQEARTADARSEDQPRAP